MSFSSYPPCDACSGTGFQTCEVCSGACSLLNSLDQEEPCVHCASVGQTVCTICHGAGITGLHSDRTYVDSSEVTFGGYGSTGQGCRHFEGLGQFCNNCGLSYDRHGT
jgi:hypothetical protein